MYNRARRWREGWHNSLPVFKILPFLGWGKSFWDGTVFTEEWEGGGLFLQSVYSWVTNKDPLPLLQTHKFCQGGVLIVMAYSINTQNNGSHMCFDCFVMHKCFFEKTFLFICFWKPALRYFYVLAVWEFHWHTVSVCLICGWVAACKKPFRRPVGPSVMSKAPLSLSHTAIQPPAWSTKSPYDI